VERGADRGGDAGVGARDWGGATLVGMVSGRGAQRGLDERGGDLRAHPCADCAGPVLGESARCQRCSIRRSNPKRWSPPELLDAVAAWEQLEGRPPTQIDWRPSSGTEHNRWQRELPRWPPASAARVVFGHTKLADLDKATYEAFIARTAWHEWGHALSVVRCSQEDIAAGRRLLDLAPVGIREGVRGAGYRSSDYTHELVAETYALLMTRRRREASGRPLWLDDEIYNLVKRVTGSVLTMLARYADIDAR
jgi:hypothetical protein